MECNEVRQRLARYADADLPEPVRGAVEAHLDHCYLCHEEWNELVALLDACRHALRHPDPRDRFDELRTRLYQPAAPVFDAPERRGWAVRDAVSALAAAAAIILILVNTGGVFSQAARQWQFLDAAVSTTEDSIPLEPRSPNVFVAWKQQIRLVRSWSDGTEIRPHDMTHAEELSPALEKGKKPPEPVSQQPTEPGKRLRAARPTGPTGPTRPTGPTSPTVLA